MFDETPPENNSGAGNSPPKNKPRLDLPQANPYFYQPGQLEEKLRNRGGGLKKIIFIILALVVLAGVSYGGYLLYNKFFGKPSEEVAVDNVNIKKNVNNSNSRNNTNIGEFKKLGELYWQTVCYLAEQPSALNYFSAGVMREMMNEEVGRVQDTDCASLTDEETGAAFGDIRTDKDNDQVNLFFEKFFLTDDALEDTDGDGYDDLTEINGGYNPSGPGKL